MTTEEIEKAKHVAHIEQVLSKEDVKAEPTEEADIAEETEETEEVEATPATTSMKKGRTAYFIFMADKKEECKKEHPEFKMIDTTKHLAAIWNELSDEEKKPYQERADAEKAAYLKYREESGETSPSKPAKSAKKQKKTKDENAPKKPKSAFMFFSADQRAEVKAANPKATFGEMGKLLGAAWANVSEEDRKQYNEQAAADKKRYDQEKLDAAN